MRAARRRVGLAVLAAAELWLADQYAVRGTSWHYLLHSLVGAGFGLALAGLFGAARRRSVSPWPWAILGQLVSITPDLIFILGRVPHQRWMDLFLGHISIHTAPQPLLVGLGMFLLGGWAWLAAALARRGAAAALGCAAIVLFGVALGLHTPLPTRIANYQSRYGPASAALAASWCGARGGS